MEREQQLLDLLVEGELDEPRRRELLLSLERQPDGWRRCALAFLETQAWRQALAARSEREELPAAQELAARPATDFAARRLLGAIGIAASLLAAFGLGLWSRPAADRPVAQESSPAVKASVETQAADEWPEPADDNETWDIDDADSDSIADDDADAVTLVVESAAGHAEPAQSIPLVDLPATEADSMWGAASAIPPEVVRKLEQMGHRVERQRRFAAVDLGEGCQIVLPVEDVQITPMAREVF